eukprot:5698640-Alexandrium_andersonii.AAC.1
MAGGVLSHGGEDGARPLTMRDPPGTIARASAPDHPRASEVPACALEGTWWRRVTLVDLHNI